MYHTNSHVNILDQLFAFQSYQSLNLRVEWTSCAMKKNNVRSIYEKDEAINISVPLWRCFHKYHHWDNVGLLSIQTIFHYLQREVFFCMVKITLIRTESLCSYDHSTTINCDLFESGQLRIVCYFCRCQIYLKVVVCSFVRECETFPLKWMQSE